MAVLVNGRAGAPVDPLDRGLQYGDGLFETIALLDGRPRFLDWHFERLADGARRLRFPEADFATLRAELASAASGESRAVLKLVLTRGLGPRGYGPPATAEPTRIVASFPWPATRTEGLRVGWCRTPLGRNPVLAGLKHLNRLEQVLARSEWDDGSLDEGLMQDELGNVVSATQANLLARIGGAWVTPELSACGVAGVMRRAFLGWSAARGEPVVERALTRAEVEGATALVLTNAVAGAVPVRALAGRALAEEPAVAAFNASIGQP
jgi:4-amino-4-deoxychorismate lyase